MLREGTALRVRLRRTAAFRQGTHTWRVAFGSGGRTRDSHCMNEMQRENFRKAVAVVTAMDATRNDVTMSVDVVMSYFRDNATVSEEGEIDLGAVDLVSGLSMLSTALLALRERMKRGSDGSRRSATSLCGWAHKFELSP
ncbi:hypothetical protein GCM10023339_02240 [Alloalcanivorax gelatiniphagus]